MRIRNQFEKWLTVVGVTAVSIALSLLLTFVLSPTGLQRNALLPAVMAPLLIAPPTTTWICNMLLRVHDLNTQLTHLLLHDSMTGLMNRRAFFELFESVYPQDGGTVLMLDIDRFKTVNDTYGHGVGDQVICDLANILKDKTDQFGKAARLGGEEFSVYYPKLPLEVTLWKAEEIRQAVEQQRVPTCDGEIAYTVSIGIDCRGSHEPIDEALKRADFALYKSKKSGRNRVSLFDSEWTSTPPTQIQSSGIRSRA